MKKTKKEPLQVGQTVWLETVSSWTQPRKEMKKEVSEMVVVKANKTSAYISYPDKKGGYYKVEQKTYHTEYSVPDGYSYRLWLSKEKYEDYLISLEEYSRLRKLAQEAINKMSIQELKNFVEENNKVGLH